MSQKQHEGSGAWRHTGRYRKVLVMKAMGYKIKPVYRWVPFHTVQWEDMPLLPKLFAPAVAEHYYFHASGREDFIIDSGQRFQIVPQGRQIDAFEPIHRSIRK